MSVDIEKLEALAKAATHLPWKVSEIDDRYITDSSGKRELARVSMRYRPYPERASYIATACNAVPDLIAENRKLREYMQTASGRAWKLAYFIAEKAVCADCPARDDCPRDDSMFLSDCIETIFKWADKEAAKEDGE